MVPMRLLVVAGVVLLLLLVTGCVGVVRVAGVGVVQRGMRMGGHAIVIGLGILEKKKVIVV